MLLSTGQTSNNRVVLRKHAADEAEERRLAGLQPGDRRQPGTGGPDERQPDLVQRVAQPVCRPRVVADELRPSLGADALRAGATRQTNQRTRTRSLIVVPPHGRSAMVRL